MIDVRILILNQIQEPKITLHLNTRGCGSSGKFMEKRHRPSPSNLIMDPSQFINLILQE